MFNPRSGMFCVWAISFFLASDATADSSGDGKCLNRLPASHEMRQAAAAGIRFVCPVCFSQASNAVVGFEASSSQVCEHIVLSREQA